MDLKNKLFDLRESDEGIKVFRSYQERDRAADQKNRPFNNNLDVCVPKKMAK